MNINSENSNTYDPQKVVPIFAGKIHEKGNENFVESSNLGIYYTWKNIKKIISKYYIQVIVSNIEFKLGFKLLGETHSVSDFPDNFEYIIKKHKTLTSNPPINVSFNKTENRVTFKIKPGYFGFLWSENVQLLESNEKKINKNRDIPQLGGKVKHELRVQIHELRVQMPPLED